MLLEVKKIVVPPGQTIILQDINWSEFEAILEELFNLNNKGYT